MTTINYDASTIANRIMRTSLLRLRKSQYSHGDGRDPIVDVYTMSGSSKLFLKSISSSCDELGFEVRTHDLDNPDNLSNLYDDLIGITNDGTDGILLIRPPYSVESYGRVSFVMDTIRTNVPGYLDIDKIAYLPFRGIYPPVAESVRVVIDSLRNEHGLGDTKAVVIGSSPFVGKPITTMVSDMFDQVVQLHLSTSRKVINESVDGADVVITYRSLDDIDINPDSYVVDVGNDNSYRLLEGKTHVVTTHMGKLTTAILLSNAVDNYCWYGS